MSVLQIRQGRRNLNDVVPRAGIDLRVNLANVVEDVEHQCAASSAHLVDEQVVIGICRQTVVGDQVPSDGFAVVRAEQLGGRMPQLASWVLAFVVVEQVFELGVSHPQL